MTAFVTASSVSVYRSDENIFFSLFYSFFFVCLLSGGGTFTSTMFIPHPRVNLTVFVRRGGVSVPESFSFWILWTDLSLTKVTSDYTRLVVTMCL